MPLVILAFVAMVAAGTAIYLLQRLRTSRAEAEALRTRFRGVVDADAERARVLAELAVEERRIRAALAQAERDSAAARERVDAEAAQLRGTADGLTTQIAQLQAEFDALDEQANLQSFGFYQPRYDFTSSPLYEARLEQIRAQQKHMLTTKTAAVAAAEWLVNGSRAEGRKQNNQTIKLMLRAFNGECDAAVARVRYNNVNVMSARIRKSWEMINSLAQVQQCSITSQYLELKLAELFLAFEYQEKLAQEKEEQRRIREQMREEEQAQRELERARQEAEKEEKRYTDALAKARLEVEQAVGGRQAKLLEQITALEQRLTEAQAQKERAIARAQLTRSGHVYVISNLGSFGEEVFKIGMTRRLDPMERIKELGDASVPFEFDVHAVIYSDDAPGLENMLHRRFHWRRVNRVNERKEFFRISIDEIATAVREAHGEIEIIRDAEAIEYRKTRALLDAEVASGGPPAAPHPERARTAEHHDGRSTTPMASAPTVGPHPLQARGA